MIGECFRRRDGPVSSVMDRSVSFAPYDGHSTRSDYARSCSSCIVGYSQVIDELQLQECADSRIGLPEEKGGISGGERKRLGVAAELLFNPPLLLLDGACWSAG